MFSTITGCFRRSASFWPTMRVAVSVGPPGGNGTTILIVWLGQAWAKAEPISRGAAARASTKRREVRASGEEGEVVIVTS